MSIEIPGAGALDYLPCRYGESRLQCRGPRRDLSAPYVAFLGSSETYGKFIPQPFTTRIEQSLEKTCVNLSGLNAGVEAFHNDPDLHRITARALVTVVQLMGATNQSNRFFQVHSRRNDRFLGASDLLSLLYRDVDFTEFSFTRHMLSRLQMISPERFTSVRTELEQAWVGRMRSLIRQIGSPVVLLWLRMPQKPDSTLGDEPLFVTPKMVDALRDQVLDVIEMPVQPSGMSNDMAGMVYAQMEAPAAMQMPGPKAHDEIAEAVTACLRQQI